MEVAVGAEDGALPEDSNDGSQELDDYETEDDMPEIGLSDSSDDEDPEILHRKYGYGWLDVRDRSTQTHPLATADLSSWSISHRTSSVSGTKAH